MTRMTSGVVTILLALAPASVMAQGAQPDIATPSDPATPSAPATPADTAKPADAAKSADASKSKDTQKEGMEGQGAQHPAIHELGIVAVDLSPDVRVDLAVPADRGVLVAKIEEGSPASKAGLKVGDVVIAIADQPITNASEVDQALAGKAGEPKFNLGVVRKGKQLQVSTRMKSQKAAQKETQPTPKTEKTERTEKTEKTM